MPRVHFGVKKVFWRRETRAESSKEEGKGYSLWELGNVPRPLKMGESSPQSPNLERNEGLEKWELGENGTLWPQPP